MSLRDELIDIIERADLAPDEQLDAMLDLLTERADEIAREAGDTFIDWQKVAPTDQWQRIVKNQAAVLRNPGSSPDV